MPETPGLFEFEFTRTQRRRFIVQALDEEAAQAIADRMLAQIQKELSCPGDDSEDEGELEMTGSYEIVGED